MDKNFLFGDPDVLNVMVFNSVLNPLDRLGKDAYCQLCCTL